MTVHQHRTHRSFRLFVDIIPCRIHVALSPHLTFTASTAIDPLPSHSPTPLSCPKMPLHPTEIQCICIKCTQQSGLGASGKPKGMMIASRHLSAYLAHVQAEQETAAASEREVVEAQLVALTLTDHVQWISLINCGHLMTNFNRM